MTTFSLSDRLEITEALGERIDEVVLGAMPS
jgi:hypothetical protein